MDQYSAGQDNFSLPHDVVKLPSNGKYYKSKKKSVKVGYLTAADENIIVNASKNGGENLIINLIRNKLYEPDLRPEELVDGDLETILIFLRNTSFGPEYEVSLTDPETGKPFNTKIMLDDLDFIKPENESDENGHYTTILPKTGTTIKLKPMNYGESIEIEKMAESYPNNMVAPRVTWKLMKQIVEVNGNSDKGEISKFIDRLPIMDSKFITNFLRKNEPRIDLNREVTAPSGKKVLARITFGAEFFRPFF